MKVIKAPDPISKESNEKYLFLAGSIEMGLAEDWQTEVAHMLENTGWIILNPRREIWGTIQNQSIHDPLFKEQVVWELDGQDAADTILMYFSPETKSPISLLELGLFAKTGKMIVVCPEGFWRKGNIEVMCDRYNIPLLEDLEAAVKMLL